jgi:hypothetical protein
MEGKMNNMSTGIQELDRLLGDGLDPGTVVLLRGGPGSGKTTLALQLIDRHLARAIRSPDDSGNGVGAAVFLSLEVKPDRALSHVMESFGFFPYLAEIPLTDGQVVVAGSTRLIQWGRGEVIQELKKRASPEGVVLVPESLGDAIVSTIQESRDRIPLSRCLIVVDSLNALLGTLLHYYRQQKPPPSRWTLPLIRDVLHGLGDMVRTTLEDSVVVFTQEYHGERNSEESIVAESFACDTEILLLHEPIAGESYRARSSLSALGYGAERQFGNREDLPQAIETRSFCRVLKSRTRPSQSRRCAYDIVRGKGVVFYETYPGDGSILLFAENERQKRTWDKFFTWDIPHNYPALRFEHFDRSGLQRTFASQRGFRYRPSRVDLCVTSFDTYWVNWYVELCQKWELASIWQEHLGLPDHLQEGEQEAFATLVSKVHRCLLERLPLGRTCPSLREISPPIREQLRILESYAVTSSRGARMLVGIMRHC